MNSRKQKKMLCENWNFYETDHWVCPNVFLDNKRKCSHGEMLHWFWNPLFCLLGCLWLRKLCPLLRVFSKESWTYSLTQFPSYWGNPNSRAALESTLGIQMHLFSVLAPCECCPLFGVLRAHTFTLSCMVTPREKARFGGYWCSYIFGIIVSKMILKYYSMTIAGSVKWGSPKPKSH